MEMSATVSVHTRLVDHKPLINRVLKLMADSTSLPFVAIIVPLEFNILGTTTKSFDNIVTVCAGAG